MGGMGDWFKGVGGGGYAREVYLPDGWSQEQPDGTLRETYTYYATRLNYKGFERQIRTAAEQLGVTYEAALDVGWIQVEVAATVIGDPESVRQFGRYATGLSAASDSGDGGGGL